jgi:hypothetical protein
LVGVGLTATAITSIVNGGIRLITITNRGGGYTSTPTIGISSAPVGGITGVATAVMIGGIVVCNDNVNPLAKSVQAAQITNPGAGYTVAPKIKFIGGGGAGAAATSTIGNGIIGIVTVTSGGSGYTASPTITFSGISTVSAAATTVIGEDGIISEIRITNAGLGYTVPPTITISSPNSSGSGSFQTNEVVTGSLSGTTARVRKWTASTNQLEISNVTGSFVSGETVVGTTSSASYKIRKVDVNVGNDGFADNNEIETEADSILDFSESNPFGVP